MTALCEVDTGMLWAQLATNAPYTLWFLDFSAELVLLLHITRLLVLLTLPLYLFLCVGTLDSTRLALEEFKEIESLLSFK